MKKIFTFAMIATVGVALMSCDKGEAYYQQWDGEYLTKQSIEYIYADGSMDKLNLVGNDGNLLEYPIQDIPLYIFKDGDLYVQTYGIGDPFMPGDSEDYILRINSPRRVIAEKDSIENVIDNEKPVVIMRDGGIYTIYKGKTISPNPIKVKKASADKLILTKGKDFIVKTTSADGSIYDEFICHWEYKPIEKKNEVYTWEAELHAKSKNRPEQLLVPTIYRHKIVIYKK